MELFLDQGAAYAKLTGLATKQISNLTESPLGCMSFLLVVTSFNDSMKMKTTFIAHFSGGVSKLIHPRSSLRTCAG